MPRWRPVASVSAPHDSINDDVYKGYHIPAGTTVVPGTWAIHHDETIYPDPFAFRPKRFLREDGEKLRPELLNEGHYSFGYGRR
jgi:cytochrome P450